MPERGTKADIKARAALDRAWRQDEPADGPPPDGWYEVKYIGGYGPYLYFRYYDGNVRRSIYLGKATVKQVTWVRKTRGERTRPRD